MQNNVTEKYREMHKKTFPINVYIIFPLPVKFEKIS